MRFLINKRNYRDVATFHLHDTWFDEIALAGHNVTYVGKGYPETPATAHDYHDVFIAYTMPNFDFTDIKIMTAFKVLFVLDYANDPSTVCKFVQKWGFNMVVSKIDFNLEVLRKELNIPVLYSPWSFDPHVFKYQDRERVYDISITGTTKASHPNLKELYDDRTNAIRELRNYNSVAYYTDQKKRGISAAKEMSRVINQSKISVVTSSSRNYLVAKYFEIPACKTLMFCTDAIGLDGIFEEGTHYMKVNKDFSDFNEKYIYIMNNQLKAGAMAQAAYNEVWTKHTHRVRAIEFLRQLNKVI